jgi:hypothetical protein
MEWKGENMKSWTFLIVAGCALAASAAGAESGLVNLEAGGRLVARYQPAPAPKKPYVKEFFTPSGVQVLLDSPSDHVHHHGLMFALGAGGTDFWAEMPADRFGAQVPRAAESKVDSSGVAQTLDWTSPAGAVQLTESRILRVQEADAGGPNVLTWSSTLRAPPGGEPVKLSGAHYFGLGMRFVREMDGTVTFLHAGGATGSVVRGTEDVTPGRWCALQGQLGGKPVTVAMFEDRRNPRTPTLWFTMTQPFAYLAGTLGLYKEPLLLGAGAPLACRYGVAVWDGRIPADEIEKACARWAAAGG